MDHRVTGLCEQVQATGQVIEMDEHLALASRISPEALRRMVDNSELWYVGPDDVRARIFPVNNRSDFPEGINAVTNFVFTRFQAAASKGWHTLFVDELKVRDSEVFMCQLAEELRGLGFSVKMGRNDTHRHCPHTNNLGDWCPYDGGLDSQLADNSTIHLVVSVPLLAFA